MPKTSAVTQRQQQLHQHKQHTTPVGAEGTIVVEINLCMIVFSIVYTVCTCILYMYTQWLLALFHVCSERKRIFLTIITCRIYSNVCSLCKL